MGENDKNGFKTRAKYLLRACLSSFMGPIGYVLCTPKDLTNKILFYSVSIVLSIAFLMYLIPFIDSIAIIHIKTKQGKTWYNNNKSSTLCYDGYSLVYNNIFYNCRNLKRINIQGNFARIIFNENVQLSPIIIKVNSLDKEELYKICQKYNAIYNEHCKNLKYATDEEYDSENALTKNIYYMSFWFLLVGSIMFVWTILNLVFQF